MPRTKHKPQTVESTLTAMLTENTGVALCDSGGAYGRNWQRNQGKTESDFASEPEVAFETDEDGDLDFYTISVFHYLSQQLDLNERCHTFNSRFVPADNWESDIYGVSADGQKWLESQQGYTLGHTVNTYNGPDHLSQVVQATHLTIDETHYVLVQIHGVSTFARGNLG